MVLKVSKTVVIIAAAFVSLLDLAKHFSHNRLTFIRILYFRSMTMTLNDVAMGVFYSS